MLSDLHLTKLTPQKLLLIFFTLILVILTLRFYFSRPVKTIWGRRELYQNRFFWLDSVNFYLDTGKILMYPMYPEHIRLEEKAVGEDQGYPFMLSVLGRLLGMKEMTFATFVHFNAFLFIFLGVISSVLIFLSFRNWLIAIVFYYFYLRMDDFTWRVDHHWVLAAFISFYLSFLIFFLSRRASFKPVWFSGYFLVAGAANIIRDGDGIVGILMFVALLVIMLVQDGVRSHLGNVRQKILMAALFVFAYSFPLLVLSGVRAYRNYVFFEGQASEQMAHHGLWHNAFMGLGYIPNEYGIHWADSVSRDFAQQVKPGVKYMSKEYFVILRRLYFQYWLESPELWLDNYFVKLKEIHVLVGTFFPTQLNRIVPEKARSIAFYGLLLTMFLLARKKKVFSAIFWIVLATLLISIIPGLIATPKILFLRGLKTVYLMTWIYFVASLYLRLKDFLKVGYV